MKNTVAGLVSIIIPIYNREAYICDCLDSVISQTYQSLEIIIVDDGFSDNSYTICNSLAEQDPKIKVFSANHGGVSNARNIALDKASGEYVFFLDSDDMIYPLLLETLVTAMESSGAAIGGTDLIPVTDQYWEQEAAFGRKKYADIQKRDAFGCFMRCHSRNHPYSPNSKKMRKVLREHKQDLFSAFTLKQQLVFYAYVYLPWTMQLISKGKSKLHKRNQG